MDLKVIDR